MRFIIINGSDRKRVSLILKIKKMKSFPLILSFFSLSITGSFSIDFYFFPPSPPCRAVMLTAKVIGKDLNMKLLNIMAGEQYDPEYLKMNPQHSVPYLIDGDVKIAESRAMMSYLITQYASKKMSSLYPKNAKSRAMVDARMYFDATSLFNNVLSYARPLFGGTKPSNEAKEAAMKSMEILESYLTMNDYVAGKKMTIADITIYVTVTTAEAVGIDMSMFPNIKNWLSKMDENLGPYGLEEINGVGVNIFKDIYNTVMSS